MNNANGITSFSGELPRFKDTPCLIFQRHVAFLPTSGRDNFALCKRGSQARNQLFLFCEDKPEKFDFIEGDTSIAIASVYESWTATRHTLKEFILSMNADVLDSLAFTQAQVKQFLRAQPTKVVTFNEFYFLCRVEEDIFFCLCQRILR